MRIKLLSAALLALWAGTAYGHSNAGAFVSDAEYDHSEAETKPVSEVRVDSDLIQVANVEQRTLFETRAGVGRVIAAAGTIHNINAFISGQLKKLYVRPGSRVRKGDPIALIDSPEFVLTQKAFVALLGNHERLDILSGEGRLPDYMKDARENLRWWGLNDADIKALEQTGKPLAGITVRSETNGVISEVLAQPGDLLSAGDRTMAQFVVMGRAIARVIDDEQPLWVEGLLFPADLAGVHVSQARVRLQLSDGQTAEYPLAAVSPALDETRQLARILVRPEQRDGLYPGQPVHLELLLPRPENVWVPRTALMGQDLETVVFVQVEQGIYVRMSVEAGIAVGEWMHVPGLEAGVMVVTHGKMALEGAYRLTRSETPHDDHHD